MKLHHLGIATKDIEKTLQFLHKTGTVKNVSEVIHDFLQDADLCMVELCDSSKVELISGKIVEKILAKKVNIYHMCYETDNFFKEKEMLLNAGAVVVSPEKPAVLFGGALVCFLLTPIGLIELLQKENFVNDNRRDSKIIEEKRN